MAQTFERFVNAEFICSKQPSGMLQRMIPLIETTFKNVPQSDVLEQLINTEAAKLERFFDRITRCRVLVEKPHRHHRTGAPYHVRIELDVPGDAIIIGSTPSEHAALARGEVERLRKSDELDTVHKYVQLAVQDAFRRAGRRLQDYARREAGAVKSHEPLPTGIVSKLEPDYGFLRTADDREVYFHRHSVLNNAFDRLRLGSMLRFVEEEGEKGAQASSVTLVHGHAKNGGGQP